MHVFSFCIYGTQEFYYRGLRENFKLIQEHYPDWHIFVYVGNNARKDLLAPMYSHPNTHWFPTGCEGADNMVWRFFAIDHPEVETMHVRDADSRCHIRDRWCINQFMNSGHLAYTIRDSSSHQIRMMGGLWGCRKLSFSLRNFYLRCREDINRRAWGFGHDQNFLGVHLWPKIRHSFASYGYAKVEEDEHYMPIDDSLPKVPHCGVME